MDEREYTFDDAYISLTDSAGAFTGTTNIDEIMKKSVIDEKFANLKQLPVTRKSRRKKVSGFDEACHTVTILSL